MSIDFIITILFFIVFACGVLSMIRSLQEDDMHGLLFAGFLLNAVGLLFSGFQFSFIASV